MPQNAYIHIPFCKTSKCYYCSFVSCPDLGLKKDYLKALKAQILSSILPSPLRGEGDFLDEQKNASNRKSGEGVFIQPPLSHPHPKIQALGPRAEFYPSPLKGEGDSVSQFRLNTLYFGGGTPSLLEINEVKEILELFSFEKDAEITFEVNPESVNFEYLSALRALGINRLSIGAQSFDDEILKLINRKHTSLQIVEAVQNAQKAGFDNISLDFIYGLPTQALNGFVDAIKRAIELNVQHISLYGLKIEEGCHFYKHKPKEIADSDTQADMYLKAIETLKNAGFEHYEISNFAKLHPHPQPTPLRNDTQSFRRQSPQGRGEFPASFFASRHNLNYWNNNSYYGFGCSASGYMDGVRYQMLSDVKKYIQNPLKRDFEQKLEPDEILEEEIFLGFRKSAGINITEINQKFGIDFEQKYAKILEKYSEFLNKTEQGYAFTTNGMLISNEILAEFIEYNN